MNNLAPLLAQPAPLPLRSMEDRLLDIIDDFTDVTDPDEYLRLDELEKIELAAAIESEFDVYVPDARLMFFTSIREITEIVRCLISSN